jgi:hypothetical protein
VTTITSAVQGIEAAKSATIAPGNRRSSQPIAVQKARRLVTGVSRA